MVIQSAMLTSDLLANFTVGVVFLSALGTLGGSLPFGISFVLAIVSFVFMYVPASEIKGRQPEAIRQYWYNGATSPDEVDRTHT